MANSHIGNPIQVITHFARIPSLLDAIENTFTPRAEAAFYFHKVNNIRMQAWLSQHVEGAWDCKLEADRVIDESSALPTYPEWEALRVLYGEGIVMDRARVLQAEVLQLWHALVDNVCDAVYRLPDGGTPPAIASEIEDCIGEAEQKRQESAIGWKAILVRMLHEEFLARSRPCDLEAVNDLKSFVVRTLPEAYANQTTPEQAVVIQQIRALVAKMESELEGPYAEPVPTSEEVREATARISPRDLTPAALRAKLEAITFGSESVREGVLRTLDEAVRALEGGMFQLATFGFGSVIETLLKEYLTRHWGKVESILERRVELQPGHGRNEFARRDDVRTWRFELLIQVCDIMLEGKRREYVDALHCMRKTRNYQHEAQVRVDESHAMFGMATVNICLDLIRGQ